MAAKTKAAKTPDWERIETDYRTGILTLREIAGGHGITEGAIRKRAKRDQWTRDLAVKVRAKAEELVRKQEVRNKVRKKTTPTEREAISIGAEVLADIKLGHRKDIAQARTLAMSLLDELTHQTGNVELYEKLGELLLAGGEEKDSAAQTKRWQALQAALSLGGRTKVMKDLADTLHKLIGLEREAFGMVEAKKLELSGKDGKPLGIVDMTEAELLEAARG